MAIAFAQNGIMFKIKVVKTQYLSTEDFISISSRLSCQLSAYKIILVA